MKKIFISYSHKDEEWKDKLHPHLGLLEKLGKIVIWDDREIGAGSEWYEKIKDEMKDADAAVCLISHNYLASDFVNKEEIPYLLERRENEGMALIPILIHPCLWKAVPWLKALQMYPRDGKSVSVDFPGDQANTIFTDVAAEIHKLVTKKVTRSAIPKPKLKRPDKIDIERLPVTGQELFGRQKELQLLDKAWESGETNVVSLVAWGGVGKSTLVNKWLEYLDKENYRGAQKVFAWSFYSQGTNERVTSADQFINEALQWFGDEDPTKGSAWDKGERLAKLIREEKTLLVLDGLEPLQSTHDFEEGKIKDPALNILVTRLAKENPGLCVITTRETVAEIQKYKATSKQKDLEQISPEAGRALLRVGGVQGTDAELEAATRDFGKHALAINLLAAYLSDIPGHHISKAKQIKDLKKVPEKKGKHPRRVIAAFAVRFGDGPDLQLLNILGLFDRPTPLGGIESVKASPVITGLTEHLVDLTEAKLLKTIENLRNVKLIAPPSKHIKDTLDCHPLVREHFAEQLQKSHKKAWREAHCRLYEYFKTQAPEYPNTLTKMEPLFAAVTHGCLAGKHQEAIDEVYFDRIRHGNENYCCDKLGAFGADLAALSNFFEPPWKQPITGLSNAYRGAVLGWFGFRLLALGHLREAVDPIQAGFQVEQKQKNWINCATAASILGDLYLMLGKMQQSVDAARQSVEFADRSGDGESRMLTRAKIAHILHQAGKTDKATILFKDAEIIQKENQPEYPTLYRYQGFLFCKLLLERGKYQEVCERTSISLELISSHKLLLDIALDNLSLGRAHFLLAQTNNPFSERDEESFKKAIQKAENYLDQAVTGLKEASRQDYLPLGLLARAALYSVQENFTAAWEDLSEAQEIAERGEMRLFLADFHLEACRLHLAQHKAGDTFNSEAVGAQFILPTPKNHLEAAKGHLKTAKEMINKMGYHRRDPEVADLRSQISKIK